jgi:V-type H+-transporting ATPase subunit G
MLPTLRLDPQHTSQTSSSQSSIDASTKQQLESIESALKAHRADAVKKIVERVIKCEPELHQNLKKVEAK